jgi:hypothetical protein
MVQLSAAKKEKYLASIAEWRVRKTHILLDVQKLYSRLLHSCLVIPAGCAYLTSLETMLIICTNHLFMPHHPPRHIDEDLDWWFTYLNQPFVRRPISKLTSLTDIHAFSDVSTSIGIAIVINGHWWAWTL